MGAILLADPCLGPAPRSVALFRRLERYKSISVPARSAQRHGGFVAAPCPVGRHRGFPAPRHCRFRRRSRARRSPWPHARLVSRGEPGREPSDAAPPPHQPHRVDSCGHHFLRCGRWRSCLPDLSRRIFSIVVACISGVSNVPSVFRRAGRNFGLTAPQLLARVLLPAALPRF